MENTGHDVAVIDTPELGSRTNVYDLYLNSLSEKEKKAYNIAKGHLGMSFQLEKSLGYLKWYDGKYK